ncbi:MAG: hypothetical protein K8T20_12690 [Planctomycetes bacterium]|nr:hypothetical protein [Planctomycetota bacterium]
MAAPADFVLDVPLVRQGPNCGCGLAAVTMALKAARITAELEDLEKHRLILPSMLQSWGIGPGRLGRVALACGARATLVDSCRRDVGEIFLRSGGKWVQRLPRRDDIDRCLAAGRAPVVCIPDKDLAFGDRRPGSHWVVVVGAEGGEYRIHDPAPWRQAKKCSPGYWDRWECSLLLVEPIDSTPVFEVQP